MKYIDVEVLCLVKTIPTFACFLSILHCSAAEFALFSVVSILHLNHNSFELSLVSWVSSVVSCMCSLTCHRVYASKHNGISTFCVTHLMWSILH
jgi:hypothetical protein